MNKLNKIALAITTVAVVVKVVPSFYQYTQAKYNYKLAVYKFNTEIVESGNIDSNSFLIKN